jgi:L-lactate dehydrogenase (cytochrome)
MMRLEIEDYKRAARRRVPRMFFDYVDSGSWRETTYRANAADLDAIAFRQRVGRRLSDRSLSTTMAGMPVSMPVALAPAGIAGMQWPDGEICAAQAAESAGVPFTLSTMSVCSLEDVAAATSKPFWFQLYVMRDRGFVRDLVARSAEAGCSAIVVTMDLQVAGQRHKDVRNGLSTPPRVNLQSLVQIAARPGWCLRMLGTRRRSFGNLIGRTPAADDLREMTSWVAEQFDLDLGWKDIEWLRGLWGGKLIVKGIMEADDALEAQRCGVDAIVVSNHGGRQLDAARSSISALPSVVDAVGSGMEVHFDGGIRSGQDVFRAVAMGARGTYIGRSYLYGLGAEGRQGVETVLGIIRKELDLTMAFCGERDIHDAGRHNVVLPV